MLFLLDNLKRNLLFRKGVRFAGRGECARALRYFDAVLEQSPNYGLAFANRAYCLAHEGRVDEAIKAYKRAAELDRDDPRHSFDAGCLLLQQGKKEAAIDLFNQALFIEPEFKPAEEALTNLTGKPPATAQAVVREPVPVPVPAPKAAAPKAPAVAAEALVAQGYEHFEEGRYRAALKAWDSALAAGYRTASLHNNRAAVLLEMREYAKAIEACDEALKIDATYNIARMTRAEVHLANGDVEAARRECDQLRTADSEMADTLEALIRDHTAPAEKQA